MHETKMLKLDISKSKNKLKWQPIISINEAVNYTSEWYEKKFKGNDEYEISLEQIKSYKKFMENFVVRIKKFQDVEFVIVRILKNTKN